MGAVTRSLALTAFFPDTKNSFDAMAGAIRFLSGRGFGKLEFCYDGDREEQVGALLSEHGFDSVYIAVFPLKASGCSLCAVDEGERRRAVEVLCGCIDRAACLGASDVMVNSGNVPKEPDLIPAACQSFLQSMDDAFRYLEKRGARMGLLLEPGDSHTAAFQLLGPTGRVCAAAASVARNGRRFGLTMDTAHIAEEGEDVLGALRAASQWCSHVHFCNCYLAEKAHPFYGDAHVDFDYRGATFRLSDYRELFRKIQELYADRDWTVTLEINCRAEDPAAWFEDVMRKCGWLFD